VSKSITDRPAVNAARDAAVDAVYRATQRLPIRPTDINADELDGRDRRLAEAIHRTTMRRWLTVNWVVDRFLTKPKIEPMLRAILATAGTQLLFMDQPDHAVVDTAVEQARRFVREGAAKLTNAVSRRLVEIVVDRREVGGWQPANNLIPWGDGAIQLSRQALLKPRRMDRYLSIATSHDEKLVAAWRQRWGDEQATALLLHGLNEPPTFLRTPAGYEPWQGGHGELVTRLASADCWVQDPTAGKAVAAVADRSPRVIVDFCAGRGTKTKQLADAFPEATIVATDTDPSRYDDLVTLFRGHERVQILPIEQLGEQPERADLLLLDVPCSNTGVLARRPEAKYRYTTHMIDSVTALQRQIVADALPLLGPTGILLYSTCSIEPAENEDQTDWIAQQFGRQAVKQQLTLPGGQGETYHDGGYYAVLEPAG
jgi:16S rRNA (cytosine967-C5)-methyltransferase